MTYGINNGVGSGRMQPRQQQNPPRIQQDVPDANKKGGAGNRDTVLNNLTDLHNASLAIAGSSQITAGSLVPKVLDAIPTDKLIQGGVKPGGAGAEQGRVVSPDNTGTAPGDQPNPAVDGVAQGDQPKPTGSGTPQGNQPDPVVVGAAQGNKPNPTVTLGGAAPPGVTTMVGGTNPVDGSSGMETVENPTSTGTSSANATDPTSLPSGDPPSNNNFVNPHNSGVVDQPVADPSAVSNAIPTSPFIQGNGTNGTLPTLNPQTTNSIAPGMGTAEPNNNGFGVAPTQPIYPNVGWRLAPTNTPLLAVHSQLNRIGGGNNALNQHGLMTAFGVSSVFADNIIGKLAPQTGQVPVGQMMEFINARHVPGWPQEVAASGIDQALMDMVGGQVRGNLSSFMPSGVMDYHGFANLAQEALSAVGYPASPQELWGMFSRVAGDGFIDTDEALGQWKTVSPDGWFDLAALGGEMAVQLQNLGPGMGGPPGQPMFPSAPQPIPIPVSPYSSPFFPPFPTPGVFAAVPGGFDNMVYSAHAQLGLQGPDWMRMNTARNRMRSFDGMPGYSWYDQLSTFGSYNPSAHQIVSAFNAFAGPPYSPPVPFYSPWRMY
jgi:hypothetical protein